MNRVKTSVNYMHVGNIYCQIGIWTE